MRWLQSGANGLLLAALAISVGRYMLGGLRGGITFTTQMRVHLAVLAGLYLASIAIGYQLDKLELVYSTNGVAAGVSFTDQNARFFAYDVLTVVAGLAGAFLVGGAFTRLLWPLGAVIIFWLSASVVLGQIYPAVIQRLSVEPDQLGKETTYIQNNIAMTRISYGLNSWTLTHYSGQDQLTQAAVTNEQGTFQNARLWDAAPLRDSLDQLQTVRQYYDFTNVDTDRYQINGTSRQVMLAGRELAPGEEPPGQLLGEPADHLHPRHRRGDGPGQRGNLRGPAGPVHPGPAAGLEQRRPAGHPAPDLLRRAAERLDRRRRPPGRVRLPGRPGRRRARSTRTPRPAGRGRPGSSSTRSSRACSGRSSTRT